MRTTRALEWSVCLLAVAACQPGAMASPTVGGAAPPVATATLAPPTATASPIVVEQEVGPATSTPLPKAAFYFFWEPG